MPFDDAVAAGYSDRISRFDVDLAELKRRDGWFSRARGIVFLISLAFALAGWFGAAPWYPMLALAAVVFVGFVTVVGFHEALLERLRRKRAQRLLLYRQLARYRRDWTKLPVEDHDVPSAYVAVVRDLDVLGKSSVYQWLSRAHTPRGKSMLRSWLLEVPTPEEVRARQTAVGELIPMQQLRDDIDLHGFLLAASETGPEAFVEWAEGPVLYEHRSILRWSVRCLTLATIVLPILLFLQWIPIAGWLVLIGLLAVNILMNAFWAGSVHDLFNRITAGRNELAHYEALFGTVDRLPEMGGRLESLRQKLNGSQVSYRSAFRELKWIMQLGGGRKSSIFGIPYVFIQILVFWDFHILVWLESWQKRCGGSVSDWFDAVAELESLASLATMAADHPDWPFPDLATGRDRIVAEQLGHPLLPIESCRRNDVELGPPGSFLLVTGSNMSGKSTLLRSIGLNAVLAQAGAPVCAARLSMPPVELATSMRVTDSLEDGVSFFMAELKRLKAIVDQSRKIDVDSGTRLLFLLDEILQGTNSAERQIAVAKVVSHLTKRPAIGAVSTHDLELANDEQLGTCCQTVHFREQFTEVDGKRDMSFDYRLREGVSPTKNALKLLEMVGLGENE